MLGHFSRATELDSDSYKVGFGGGVTCAQATHCVGVVQVWHSWAVMNFRVIQHYQLTSDTEKVHVALPRCLCCVVLTVMCCTD